jgi:hypothetical protein
VVHTEDLLMPLQLNVQEFKAFCLIPTLETMGEKFCGQSAENIVLFTIAHESLMGAWRKQMGCGAALGIVQMEPPTYNWLAKKYPDVILKFYPEIPRFEAIENDDVLAVIMCRLRYYVVKEPLPEPDDIKGMARYWKEYYNTNEGKGNEQEFIRNFKKFMGPRTCDL